MADRALLAAALRVGPRLWAEIAWSLVVGGRRSMAADAARVMPLLDPPPRLEGLHLVPRQGPFLLTANHFDVPGLWIGWVAAAITRAVIGARSRGWAELHWVITSEWGRETPDGGWQSDPVSSWLFPRAARCWSQVAVPANPAAVGARASALREVLSYLGLRGDARAASPEPVAMFPEGTGTVGLAEARPGSGAFIYRISRMGVPILPVGVRDEGHGLAIRFGAPFVMPEYRGGRGSGLDEWARREVMAAIGLLLPRHLWGLYAEEIEARMAGQGFASSEPEKAGGHAGPP